MPPLESAPAIRRYDEEHARARVTRLRLGTDAPGPLPGESPDFSAWLTSLLPAEQRLGPLARSLTASAAAATARNPAAQPLPIGQCDEELQSGSAPPPAAQLFGLAWRALGVEPDPLTGVQLALAGEEPLAARPIRSSPLRVLQEARQAYAATPRAPGGK